MPSSPDIAILHRKAFALAGQLAGKGELAQRVTGSATRQQQHDRLDDLQRHLVLVEPHGRADHGKHGQRDPAGQHVGIPPLSQMEPALVLSVLRLRFQGGLGELEVVPVLLLLQVQLASAQFQLARLVENELLDGARVQRRVIDLRDGVLVAHDERSPPAT